MSDSCASGCAVLPTPVHQSGGYYDNFVTKGGYCVTKGGYCASFVTRSNRNLLRAYKAGKSIGFTKRSSLRAKGLLPRVSRKYRGKYVLGPKYSGIGRDRILTKRAKFCKKK